MAIAVLRAGTEALPFNMRVLRLITDPPLGRVPLWAPHLPLGVACSVNRRAPHGGEWCVHARGRVNVCACVRAKLCAHVCAHVKSTSMSRCQRMRATHTHATSARAHTRKHMHTHTHTHALLHARMYACTCRLCPTGLGFRV